jgi:hypothetical protein
MIPGPMRDRRRPPRIGSARSAAPWVGGLVAIMALAAGGPPARGQTGLFDWTTAAVLHPGILHADLTLTSPNRLQVNCLRIDTLAPGLFFSTTPRASSWQPGVRETILQTTPNFITSSRTTDRPLVAAVNANLYTVNGSAANLTGFAVSEGLLVSPGVTEGVGKASFSVTAAGVPSILDTIDVTTPGNSWTAVSGIYQCLANGSPRLSGTDRQPRTGIGVSADTRYVYLMTIDGRSTASVGATNREVGEWLASFGAWDGIYMDGGGSTTMAWWNPAASGSNKTQVLNTPSDGSPRSVGNNVGVYFTTPVYAPGELWWAGDGVRGGSGSWTPAVVSWRDGAIYGPDVAWNSEPAPGTTAIFAGPAGTVVPSGGVSVESLDFRTTGYRLGSTSVASDLSFVGTPALSLADSATLLVTARLAGTAPELVGGGGATAAQIVLRPLGGGSTLTGTARLSGNLTVELGSTAALGTAAVEVAAGSGLDLKVDGGVFPNDLVLAGTGSTGLGGAVRFSNTGSLAGDIELAGDATIRAGGLFSVTATLAGDITGPGGLTVTGIGSSRVMLAGRALHTGGTRVTAGTLQVTNPEGLAATAVTVDSSGRLALAGDTHLLVDVGGLTVDQDTGGGRVDLGAGQLSIAPGGISAADLRADIIAGRNGGAWDGAAGIMSSTAAAAGDTRAVGYVVAGDGSAQVSFAAPGDIDLGGQVNIFDLIGIASAGKFGTGQAADWSQGDFNYDGVADVVDLLAIDASGVYGTGNYFPAAPPSLSGSVAVVPEPASVLGWALAGLAAGAVYRHGRRGRSTPSRWLPCADGRSVSHVGAR